MRPSKGARGLLEGRQAAREDQVLAQPDSSIFGSLQNGVTRAETGDGEFESPWAGGKATRSRDDPRAPPQQTTQS